MAITIRCTDPRHGVEWDAAGNPQPCARCQREADNIYARAQAEERAARDFYAGKSFERQVARDALGDE